MHHLNRLTWTALLGGTLFLFAGCNPGPQFATVSGNVDLDGTPVAQGGITFIPTDGKSQTTGGEIVEGVYSVQVPPGTMKVSISVPKVVGKKKIYATPDSPEMPVTKEAAPPRYNEQSELRLDVAEDDLEHDFHLKSDTTKEAKT